jgi:predicted helicase
MVGVYNMQFEDILKKYREIAFSGSDLGTRFEELIARYLMTDPLYSSKLEKVWSWNNFPYRKDISDHDTGIDLVARTKTGEYWAIQCKFYSEGHRVSKDDVDTFLSTSGKQFRDESGERRTFSYRMIVATTNDWTETAVKATENQAIPVIRIGLNILREARVDWAAIEEGVHGTHARKKRYELRPHQKEAFDKAIEHYEKNDRGQMIMACGTGKTFTSLRIAEALSADGNQCVLFLAPSISLVGQTLREWTSNAEHDLNTIAVCSDPKVTKRRSDDDLGEHVEDLGAPATTDPNKIVEQYQSGEGLTVIFSTYQSIDAVIDAQKLGLPAFDLIVCDEAHRTTGVIVDGQNEKHFTKVHSDDNVKAKRRLYMTATPRLYGVKGKEDAKKEAITLCSMDDAETYGTVFYKIGFGEAVERDLLSDYKVLVLTVEESEMPDLLRRQLEKKIKYGDEVDTELVGKIWGCMNALAKNIAYDETVKHTDPKKMTSAVAFCSTVASSKDITDIFNDLARSPMSPIDLEMKHIDGSMNALKRDGLLSWLKSGDPECRVLSNVRCLSEGVDVPALDAVMFLSNKNSLIDIVQSVGRVMRKAPGKKYGYIIVPVIVPEGQDVNEALDDDERYKAVWQVLRALRSHDERLEAEVNTIQYSKNIPGRVSLARLDKRGDYAGDDYDVGRASRQYLLDDFETALMARLVLKVGDRNYIENWAKDVAVIMPELIERLTKICSHEEHGYKQFKPAFNRYMRGLRANINGSVTEDDAIKMLAQQIITKPIFIELFGNDTFVQQNPVSSAINAMLDEINEKDALKGIELEGFYKNVKDTLSRINTKEGKQKVITALYEKFFKNAFPKDQAINGVVYTPIEVVDFILRSAADVLKDEFGIDINDENVNILDPFTGTGTFIARLIETGIIDKDNLERKYRNELFANEITLLAYYIAAVNIENAYSRVMESESYVPFDNILLTDTFNIEEICRPGSIYNQTDLTGKEFFSGNKKRIRKEHETPITLIIGNPPYGAVQKSANDDAKKRRYEAGVDEEIRKKYLDDSLFDGKKGLVNSVYDNYVRAFRWATDRIGNKDGVIAFITPNGWLTGSAFEGFRKTIEKEFSKIYIFDLRGDQNSGDWRKEGEKVFGEGSKVGIAITLLIKRKDHTGKAKIQYFKTPDYAKRTDKFNLLIDSKSFIEMAKKKKLETIKPKPNGDWIIERNELFQELIPLAGDTRKKFDKHNEDTVFVGYTNGFKTNRDAWVYNYQKKKTANNMKTMIEEYNRQVDVGIQSYNAEKISWDGTLEGSFKKKKKAIFEEESISISQYRPFTKKWFYYDGMMINSTYQMPRIFPTPETKNLLICVAGVGDKANFSCLMTDNMTDLHIIGTSQCFPLYWYEDKSEARRENKQISLFGDDTERFVRHDGISDYILGVARMKYGQDVTKEDIFYYVYGYLHSPEYRELFSDDLKMSLPRIGLVESKEDFLAFSEAGRRLADLHTNYEKVEPFKGLTFTNGESLDSLLADEARCRVTKMKVLPDEGKVEYNNRIIVSNIPKEAFEYTLNGRSAIGWIADQYRYTVDKKSGIVNDPNEYAGGSYVLKLLCSVITVSVKTMEIVNRLPKLNLEEAEQKPSLIDEFTAKAVEEV